MVYVTDEIFGDAMFDKWKNKLPQFGLNYVHTFSEISHFVNHKQSLWRDSSRDLAN